MGDKFVYRKKPKDNDFFSSWLFQRRIAKPIVLLLAPTSITPNQISAISVIVGLFGIFFLFKGLPIYDLIGIIILHLAAILDCVDGDLARTREMEFSLTGKFADYIKVIILDPLIPISLAIGLVNQSESIWWIISIVTASFWKMAPQFAREHILVRSLEKHPELVSKEKAIPLFLDPQQSIKNKSSRKNIFQLFVKLVKLIIGLPNALLNTLFVLSLLGLIFLSPLNYIILKKYLLGLIIVSYMGFFAKALLFEVKNMKYCDKE